MTGKFGGRLAALVIAAALLATGCANSGGGTTQAETAMPVADPSRQIRKPEKIMEAAYALQKQYIDVGPDFAPRQDFLKTHVGKIEKVIADCTGQSNVELAVSTCAVAQVIAYDLLSQYAEYNLTKVSASQQAVLQGTSPLCAGVGLTDKTKEHCELVAAYAGAVGGRIAATQLTAELKKPAPQVADISPSITLLLQETAGWPETNIGSAAATKEMDLRKSVTCSASKSSAAVEGLSGDAAGDAAYHDLLQAIANGSRSLKWQVCPSTEPGCDLGACTRDPDGLECAASRAGTAALLCK
jgi:hypothetical protein